MIERLFEGLRQPSHHKEQNTKHPHKATPAIDARTTSRQNSSSSTDQKAKVSIAAVLLFVAVLVLLVVVAVLPLVLMLLLTVLEQTVAPGA